jgi:hypothetical protein
MMLRIALVFVSVLCVESLSRNVGKTTTPVKSTTATTTTSLPSSLSRRDALLSAAVNFGGIAGAGFVATTQQPVWAAGAAGSPPTPQELERISIGYKQISDLLNNFEEATTTCRENGGECKRDAEPIRKLNVYIFEMNGMSIFPFY